MYPVLHRGSPAKFRFDLRFHMASRPLILPWRLWWNVARAAIGLDGSRMFAWKSCPAVILSPAIPCIENN